MRKELINQFIDSVRARAISRQKSKGQKPYQQTLAYDYSYRYNKDMKVRSYV